MFKEELNLMLVKVGWVLAYRHRFPSLKDNFR